ncbi:MAG TPA: glycosyltransferase family A protein, partial [Fimbriimonadaceae bacterium]|nr:glycosyltransferase family A protein [Fimbriimonadaceae bacterium]
MSRAPAVSILTPTYRHAAFIESTIASVQAQTFEDWEMLVLDDGSDDGTADLAEAIGDPRVRVFREPHRGIERLEETYNRGLAEARGDLVAILEGDDLWPAEKIAIQVPDFDDPSVVLSAGKM